MISGTYRREAETMRECDGPRCKGGEVRTEIETPTSYRVTIDFCKKCGGTGVLPKARVA